MKRLLLYMCALASLACAGCELQNNNSNQNQAQFTMPGTAIQTMPGEVPFANFTIEDDEVKTITYEETTTVAITTTEEQSEPETAEISTEESTVIVETVPIELVNPENPDYIVVLDPGHGGDLPGAFYNGFVEKDLTLDVGFRVREYLLRNYSNVAVYMTRAEDIGFSSNATEDLEYRANFAANKGANLLVSLHFNVDAQTHRSKGSMTFISKQPWVYEQSVNLSNCIINQLAAYGISTMGPFTLDSDKYYDDYGNPLDYYAINRMAASLGIVGVIVEHCFMDNPEELIFFQTEAARQNLAEADARGIAEYLGLQPR